MIRLLIPLVVIIFIAYARGKPLIETPETPAGDICQALKKPHPKKDVEILPYCPPSPVPTPEETPTKPGKKVEP